MNLLETFLLFHFQPGSLHCCLLIHNRFLKTQKLIPWVFYTSLEYFLIFPQCFLLFIFLFHNRFDTSLGMFFVIFKTFPQCFFSVHFFNNRFLKSLLLIPVVLVLVLVLVSCVSGELSLAVCVTGVFDGLAWGFDFCFKALGINITWVLAWPWLKQKKRK